MMNKDERKRRALEKKLRDTRAQFIAERNEVLRSLDPEKFMALFLKWQQPPPKYGGPEMVQAIMHRARLALHTEFTYGEKLTSAMWLVGHGFELPAVYSLDNGVLYEKHPAAPGAANAEKKN